MSRNLGVPTAPSVLLDKGDVIDLKAIINAVGLPCFVKANRSGSSFGVFKASTLQELEESIPKALEEDTQLLIEQALEGREISLGVVRLKNKITVLPLPKSSLKMISLIMQQNTGENQKRLHLLIFLKHGKDSSLIGDNCYTTNWD